MSAHPHNAHHHPPAPALTIDMDALLERATADCVDSSDLEEFCAALIRRIITLETLGTTLEAASYHGRFCRDGMVIGNPCNCGLEDARAAWLTTVGMEP
jgi:hypothetical protein